MSPIPAFAPDPEDCPLEQAIVTIGGKWKLQVLRALYLGGPQRYNRLLDRVSGISAKELTRNLRELEASGLVSRAVAEDGADYALTGLGQAILPTFQSLGSFGKQLQEQRRTVRAKRSISDRKV